MSLKEHKLKIDGLNVNHVENKKPVNFKATLYHFLGEVEAIFAIWLIPLMILIFFVLRVGQLLPIILTQEIIPNLFLSSL